MSFVDILRDALFGNPPSPTVEPSREGVLAAFTGLSDQVSLLVSAAVAAGALPYATRAALYADLAHAAGTTAIVYGDSDPAKNGFYVKVGATGSGSWTITGLLLTGATGAQGPAGDAGDVANITEATEAGLNSIGTATSSSVSRVQNGVPFSTYVGLAATTGMVAGDRATVAATDTGTHTDPVVGGTVANSGTYSYSASPAGWQRTGALDSVTAQGFATAAATSAGTAGAASRAEAIKAAYRKDPTANLFDPSKATGSKSINSGNGAATNQNINYSITDFIPVIPGLSISTLNALGYNGQGGAFYTDATEGSFISGSGFTSVSAGGTLSVPSTANFMRVTIQTVSGSTLLGKTHIVHGPTAPTVYRAANTPDSVTIRKLIDAERFARPDPNGNFYVASKAQVSKSVNTGDGSLSAASVYMYAYEMAVNAGETLYFTHGGAAGNGISFAFLDAQGAKVSSMDGYAARTAYIVPESAVLLRVSFHITMATDPVTNILSPQKTFGIYKDVIPALSKSGGTVDTLTEAQRMTKANRRAKPIKTNLYVKRDVSAGILTGTNAFTVDNTGQYITTDYMEIDDTQPLCSNVSFNPGSGNYAWCFYDRDDVFVYSPQCSFTADVTSGAYTLNVTAKSKLSALGIGSPISGAGIPGNSWIDSVPSGQGLGAYTFTNLSGTDSNGNPIPTPATATTTGASCTSGGVLADVPIYPPTGLGITYARTTLSTYTNPADVIIANATTTSAAIGWQDVVNTLPFAGKGIVTLGDSIMNDTTGDNLFQEGIALGTRGVPLWQCARGGSRISEALRYKQAPHSGPGVTVPEAPMVAADFTNAALVVCNSGTNNVGIHQANSTVPAAAWPVDYTSPIGTIQDRWIPTKFTATITGGQNTLTNIVFDSVTGFGSLQNGMPLSGIGMPANQTLVDLGSGNWGLSQNATTSSSSSGIYGGTIYGDLYDLYIRKLQTWNQYMRLVHIGIMPRFDDFKAGYPTGPTPGNPINGRGLKLTDYNDAIRAFCEANGVLFIDPFKIGTFNAANYASNMDGIGLHPTRPGYQNIVLPRLIPALNAAGANG